MSVTGDDCLGKLGSDDDDDNAPAGGFCGNERRGAADDDGNGVGVGNGFAPCGFTGDCGCCCFTGGNGEEEEEAAVIVDVDGVIDDVVVTCDVEADVKVVGVDDGACGNDGVGSDCSDV